MQTKNQQKKGIMLFFWIFVENMESFTQNQTFTLVEDRSLTTYAGRTEAAFGERGRKSPDFCSAYAVNQGIDTPRSRKKHITSDCSQDN